MVTNIQVFRTLVKAVLIPLVYVRLALSFQLVTDKLVFLVHILDQEDFHRPVSPNYAIGSFEFDTVADRKLLVDLF